MRNRTYGNFRSESSILLALPNSSYTLSAHINLFNSIGGRNSIYQQFADDIDALAGEEHELEALVESLDKTCTRYEMEISAKKTKLMTNSAKVSREIKVKGQKVGTLTSFKYL